MSWDNNNIWAISEAYDRWYLTPIDWEDEDEEEEPEELPLEQMWGESDEAFKKRCWSDPLYEVPDKEWDEYWAWYLAKRKEEINERQKHS